MYEKPKIYSNKTYTKKYREVGPLTPPHPLHLHNTSTPPSNTHTKDNHDRKPKCDECIFCISLSIKEKYIIFPS